MRLETARRSLDAHTLALALLAALVPTLYGSAIAVSRFAASLYSRGLDRDLLEWVIAPREKLAQLIGYSIIFLGLVILFGAAMLVRRHAALLDRHVGRCSAIAGLAATATVAIGGCAGLLLIALRAPIAGYGAIGMSWLVFGLTCTHAVFRAKRGESFGPMAAVVPLVIGVAPLLYALLLTPFAVPNEFLALPEETLLNGERVDNLRYINSSGFEGLRIPDPRLETGGPTAVSIRLDASRIGDPRHVEAFAHNKPYRFWYDRASKRIEIHGALDAEEYQYLLPLVVGSEDLDALQRKFADTTLAELKLAKRRYSAQELAFLRANTAELERQLVLGRFFYHHSFLFLPALGGALEGKAAVASQYGRGLTEFFSAMLRQVPEELRFNAYLALLYASYPLYLLSLLLVARRFGLSPWGAIFVGAFAILSYLISDLETVRLGVGLMPWRHFFDVAAFLLFYEFAKRASVWLGILLAVAAGSVVYWSRETGLFLTTGLAFALITHAHTARRVSNLAIAALCALAAAAGWHLGDPGATTDLTVTLLGINTPPLPVGFVQVLAAAMVGAGAVWWVLRPVTVERDPIRYADWAFLGGALVYAAASGVYLLWYPRPHHLVLTLPTIGLALAVAHRYRFPHDEHSGSTWVTSCVAATLALTVALGLARCWEAVGEARIFRDHVVHEWVFPGGRMTSTGQPQLLGEAIDLIRRSEPGTSVNILSPWEVVLMPFAGKYKAGPFPVSFDSLFSDKEVRQLAAYLVSAPSGVLFVDSRIMRGEYEVPLGEKAYMKDRVVASQLRIAAHATLRRVFEAVRACYSLREKGPLISAYVRKEHARMTAGGCRADD